MTEQHVTDEQWRRIQEIARQVIEKSLPRIEAAVTEEERFGIMAVASADMHNACASALPELEWARLHLWWGGLVDGIASVTLEWREAIKEARLKVGARQGRA